ncbi:hypothetical protein ANCCAN_16861 [Ancylostoma caninum]|uniref:SCP domain-containing protein n=1 Tax=Ancylostoma caninum TaxID=29170 RepID=A0A368G0K5_ANCCA|nr:hypothetical protein ANCCAN_16861 [Ancylostoma caninum]
MEDQAWQKVKDCPTPPTTVGTYGVSEEVVSTKKNCNATTVTETTLKAWWNELRTKYDKATAQMKYVKAEIPHFGVMAYSKSKAFGCTYQPCKGSLHLICVYNENGADPNEVIYDAGAPMCNSCANTCADALCPDKLEPAKDLDPICGQANVDKMSDDLRNTALFMHNYYRRLLATGWAKDKQIGYAKTAAKMPVLKYSCQLENAATTYTATCPTATENANGAENFWDGSYLLSKEDAVKEVCSDTLKTLHGRH